MHTSTSSFHQFQETSTNKANDPKSNENFECNICIEPAIEPVITRCGHLYCWECIYVWLNQRAQQQLLCPVCKAGVSVNTLIPIYSRSNENENVKRRRDPNIPNRPQPERMPPVDNPNRSGPDFGDRRGNGSTFVMGFGLFPALFSMNFTWDTVTNDGLTNEQRRERHIASMALMFFGFLLFSWLFFGSFNNIYVL